jgi:hypothetical protein
VSRRNATPVLPLVSASSVARFWSKVDRRGPAECWPWLGLLRPETGYGRFPADGKIVSAHRFAWVMVAGRDPLPGMELDHLCRNRACVNPAHLEEVSWGENTRRSNNPAGRNSRKTHCLRGHPFDEVNTYIRPDGMGRGCRQCNRERQARFQSGKRGAA